MILLREIDKHFYQSVLLVLIQLNVDYRYILTGNCRPIMMRLGEVKELNLNHNLITSIPETFGR